MPKTLKLLPSWRLGTGVLDSFFRDYSSESRIGETTVVGTPSTTTTNWV